jgi:Calcineurin-like phosphoesterase
MDTNKNSTADEMQIRVAPPGALPREKGGVYSSPDRRAIFVGDLIDRGPAIGEVIEIVEGMVRAGVAHIVMGNHEFNALCYHTPDGKGEYLRPRTKKNPGAKDRALTWIYSFPLDFAVRTLVGGDGRTVNTNFQRIPTAQ